MSLTYKEQPVAYVGLSALLAVAVIFGLVKTWNAAVEHKYIGKPTTVRDTITIDGTGKATSKPDLAMVQFSVVTQGSNPKDVQTANTNQMNAVTQALKDLGIKSDDLETSGYSLMPNYDYNKQPYVIQGYSISQTLSIKIRDFSKIGTVLERSVALGINQVNNIQFTIDEPESLRDEARMKALENANKKAKDLAKALDVDIVRVVSFSENGYGGPVQPMPMYGRDMAVTQSAGVAPEIQTGTQDVNMNVSVTYEIR